MQVGGIQVVKCLRNIFRKTTKLAVQFVQLRVFKLSETQSKLLHYLYVLKFRCYSNFASETESYYKMVNNSVHYLYTVISIEQKMHFSFLETN